MLMLQWTVLMAQNYARQWVYIFSTFWVKSMETVIRFVPRLACFEYTKAPQTYRIRKDVIQIFKEYLNLTVTCKTNMKAVNFLDVTLIRTTG